MRQYHVGRERNQFRRASANLVGFGSGPVRVDAHVASDDPARFCQALVERPEPRLIIDIVCGCGKQHADAPNPVRLLRARRERPRRRSAAEQRDELAALHSITSSAVASSLSGTVSPSALAVFRLMTSSYLVGACTGRSAGFSPLRMRST